MSFLIPDALEFWVLIDKCEEISGTFKVIAFLHLKRHQLKSKYIPMQI